MRKRNLIAGRGAEHRRGKPRLGNTSFTKQKCRTGTGPSPSPTDCPLSMRGGALESVQPEGRWVRWAGKYHPPLPRNGIVFVLAQRQVASILFFPHWFTGLVTLTHLQSSCPLIWSLESLRGTQIIPRSLEMVSVLTRARDAGQGLMRTRHLLTRHRVVTPGVCGYAGSGFRSELSPLWLTAGWLARQPGPLAVCSVTSRRDFGPGASRRGSACAARLLPQIVRWPRAWFLWLQVWVVGLPVLWKVPAPLFCAGPPGFLWVFQMFGKLRLKSKTLVLVCCSL